MTAESTLLLLVRHGETPTTGLVLPGRAPGLHLSERGVAQADLVAERLAGLQEVPSTHRPLSGHGKRPHLPQHAWAFR